MLEENLSMMEPVEIHAGICRFRLNCLRQEKLGLNPTASKPLFDKPVEPSPT